MSTTQEPTILTYEEAALVLGISTRSLKRLVADGSVRHIKVSAQSVRFSLDDLTAYLAAQARGGTPIYDAVERDLAAKGRRSA